MLKNLLKEAHKLLCHLKETGYFNDEDKPKTLDYVRSVPREYAIRVKGKKLRREEAVDIYNEDRYSFQELAELYNVHTSTIYDIKCGRSWRKATGHKGSTLFAAPKLVAVHGKKLNEKEVLAIYKDTTHTPDELAKIYDVTSTSIRNIKCGYTWSKVTGQKYVR